MTGSAGWGDAIVAVPWELYEAYGDTEVLAENWDAMSRWVEWALDDGSHRTTPLASTAISRTRAARGIPVGWVVPLGGVDRAEGQGPDGNPINPIQANPMAWFTADKGEVGTAYLYRSTLTTPRACAGVLGRDDDRDRYKRVAAQVLDAWRTEFLRPEGRTATDSQASYVRALSFGLIPDDLRNAAAGRLVELIRDAGTHLGTGFLSTGHLLPVLAGTGYADVAYELLLQRSAPSWMYMLDHGATTIWEEWEGIDDRGRAHESLNHYSKGAVIHFLHTHVLGLRQAPGSVAWEHIVIELLSGASPTWAAVHQSPRHHPAPSGRSTTTRSISGLHSAATDCCIVFLMAPPRRADPVRSARSWRHPSLPSPRPTSEP